MKKSGFVTFYIFAINISSNPAQKIVLKKFMDLNILNTSENYWTFRFILKIFVGNFNFYGKCSHNVIVIYLPFQSEWLPCS